MHSNKKIRVALCVIAFCALVFATGSAYVQQQAIPIIEWYGDIPPMPLYPSRWEGAFGQITEANPTPNFLNGFPRTNDNRFGFRIRWDGIPGFPTDRRDEIMATVRTYAIIGGPAYDEIQVPLTETGNASLVFELGRLAESPPAQPGTLIEGSTRPFIVVTNGVDMQFTPPDITPPNQYFRRTILGQVQHRLSIEYPNATSLTRDLGFRSTIRVRPHRFRRAETYVDTGVMVLPLVVQGEGDGRFTFIDTDNDETHDAGETSEYYWNEADGASNAWDRETPVVTADEVRTAKDQMDRTWGQAGIRFDLLQTTSMPQGDLDPREPPGAEPWEDDDDNDTWTPGESWDDFNGNGVWDPPVNLWDGNLSVAVVPSGEYRNMLDTAGDRDPKTIDWFIVNDFDQAWWGLEYCHGWGFGTPVYRRNAISVIADGVGRPFTPSHEACHVLRNRQSLHDTGSIFLLRDGTSNSDAYDASKRMFDEHITQMLNSESYAELRQ